MSGPDEPRHEDFAGRPLTEWTKSQLEDLADSQRRDPPKVRLVIDELDAAGVDAVSDLNDDQVADLRKRVGLTPFAPLSSVFKALKTNAHEESDQVADAGDVEDDPDASPPAA